MIKNLNFYITILLFLVTLTFEGYSQNYGTLRGFITDSTNGEILAYANIRIDGTRQGSSSDNHGFYIIPSVPAGKHTVVFTFVGYLTQKIEVVISSGKTTELNCELIPVGLRTKEVVKIGEVKRDNETDAGLLNITGRELQIIPRGVEADLMRSLRIIPGVKTSNDISARYYVRGGGSDQNLVLLDGVSIYNPYHALGIFSVIDPDIINNVQFYKGSFPVEFGGRLSSVMNIKTNDGNKNNFTGTGSASFLTTKLSAGGPLPYGSFLVNGRKSYFGKVMRNFLNNKDAPFDFYDVLMKVNIANPNWIRNSNFSFRTLLSNDNIIYGDKSLPDYKFSNNVFSVNYFQVWEKPLWSDINLSISNYSAEVIPNLSTSKTRQNKVKEFMWSNNFTFLFDSRDELGLGLQMRTFSSDFKFQNRIGNSFDLNSVGANFDIFAKYKLLRFEGIGLEGGIRFSPISYTKAASQLIFPNLILTYRFIPEIAFKAAVGIYKQEIIAYSDENEVVNIFEPYLVIPEYLSPSKAIHYSAGFDIGLSEFFNIQIESYYKTLRNIVDMNRNKLTSQDNDLVSTQGESYGVEFTSKYSDESYYFSLGYTLSWAFKGLEDVRYYPRYDSRHSVDLLASVDIGAGFKVGAIWSFNTGRPFTQSAGFYDKTYISDYWNRILLFDYTKPYTLLGGRNAARLPVYHRLDLTVSKDFIFYFMKLSLEANVMNVYDRKNIFYFDRSTGDRINMLPFLPSVSLKVQI